MKTCDGCAVEDEYDIDARFYKQVLQTWATFSQPICGYTFDRKRHFNGKQALQVHWWHCGQLLCPDIDARPGRSVCKAARQLLTDKSDLTRSAELLVDAQIYVYAMNAQKDERKADQCSVPDGLRLLQVF